MRLRHSSSRQVLAAVLTGLAFASGAQAQEHPSAEVDEHDEVEALIVHSTRSGRRVQDEAIRVEVINQEEIEEKVLMTPGNIAMMVAETGGVRVQVTSPALGAASIRMQGMRGRYTQLLADGLPLYGGQALGVLQIPPSDLGQVEVIKGAASALYGPAALGGVINLISRRPEVEPLAEVLLNATTRDGQDATIYAAAPLSEGWSASVMGGAHRQSVKDLDKDGWIDTPGYDRWTLRPRLFWEGAGGGQAYFTLGAMREDRQGGTVNGRTAPDGRPFAQDQDSRRLDAGFTSRTPIEGLGDLHLRASAVTQKHEHRYGDVVENDRHRTLFAEASLAAGSDETTTWLVGAAIQGDRYRNRTLGAFDYSFTTPALFAQVERKLADALTLAGSARWDDHSEYGSHFSPRVSLLYRPGPWTVRASVGRGFYAPTPFVEEIEAAGLSRLRPLGKLKAETADTASLEAGYAKGRLEANLTLFGSRIDDAVQSRDVSAGGVQQVELVNAPGATRTAGLEALLRYRVGDFTVTGSYVYVDATEPDPDGSGRRVVPTTPRHTAGVVGMWEKEGKGRLGVEAYYTGRQDLEDNPYRSKGKPYLELGVLAEAVVSENVRVFVNLENLLNVRQTKYDPLVLPLRGAAGEWTVDAWAPTEGFVFNGGVRLRFGGG